MASATSAASASRLLARCVSISRTMPSSPPRSGLQIVQGVQDIRDHGAVTYVSTDLTPADAPVVLDYEGRGRGYAVAEKIEYTVAAGGCAVRISQDRESGACQ